MIAVIETVDATLSDAGLPTYSELVSLLNEAQKLGLRFDAGNAYIRRVYIDKQTDLNNRIARVNAAIKG